MTGQQDPSAGVSLVETIWERRRRLVSLEIERIALGEFALRGYENVTIEQIAIAAGITTRSFYRYFAGKEDVLLAMPRRVTTQLCNAVRDRPPDESVIESYRQAIAARADASFDDEQIALQWRDIFRTSSGLPWMVTDPSVIETVVEVIADRLHADPRHDPRPRVVAAAVVGALDIGLSRWLASGGVANRQEIMIEALDILESLNAPSLRATTRSAPRTDRSARLAGGA